LPQRSLDPKSATDAGAGKSAEGQSPRNREPGGGNQRRAKQDQPIPGSAQYGSGDGTAVADITRDYDQSKTDYESLLAKKNQSEMSTDLEKTQQGEHFRMLDPPNLPVNPINRTV
jgi:hypothetical protein